MGINIGERIYNLRRWLANTIVGGDFFIAEEDAHKASENLVWLNGRLAEEQERCKVLERQIAMPPKQASSLKPIFSHKCPEPTATDVIEKVLKRPIQWVDKSKLDLANRRVWGGHARSLTDNPLFQAICGKIGSDPSEDTSGELVKIMIEHIAKHSKNHEETRDLRMCINGIERIREEVNSWLFFENTSTNEELNAPM